MLSLSCRSYLEHKTSMNYMLATRLFQDRWGFANLINLVKLDQKIRRKYMHKKEGGFIKVFSKICDRKGLAENTIKYLIFSEFINSQHFVIFPEATN